MEDAVDTVNIKQAINDIIIVAVLRHVELSSVRQGSLAPKVPETTLDHWTKIKASS